VIDGYHAFMAVPTDLSSIQDRAFYLAGSYKYAQGGEGACFLYVPPSTRHRPAYTGWFAELSHLTNVGNQVGYPEDALQYAGSTMDFSAVYRLVAVLEKFKAESLSVEKIHAHVKALQDHFVQELEKAGSSLIRKKNLLSGSFQHHGHFLTFELPSTEKTIAVGKDLEKQGLQTDSRSNRLRFGFGLHQEKADVEKAINLIAKT
jgi:selenocysteine lyase/cysteine desulfurase